MTEGLLQFAPPSFRPWLAANSSLLAAANRRARDAVKTRAFIDGSLGFVLYVEQSAIGR